MSVNGETIFRVLPSVLVAATAWALAWLATGSIDSADWLLYAVFAGLLLAVLLTAAVARPTTLELAGLAGLVLLSGWEALSLTWSAVPNLARDEALLTLFYAIVLLVPLLTLRGPADRLLASGAVAAEAAVLAVATALTLRFGSNQADHFYAGRLSFPISYPNAQAAAFLIGFWPAVVCAAQRRAPSAPARAGARRRDRDRSRVADGPEQGRRARDRGLGRGPVRGLAATAPAAAADPARGRADRARLPPADAALPLGERDGARRRRPAHRHDDPGAGRDRGRPRAGLRALSIAGSSSEHALAVWPGSSSACWRRPRSSPAPSSCSSGSTSTTSGAPSSTHPRTRPRATCCSSAPTVTTSGASR